MGRELAVGRRTNPGGGAGRVAGGGENAGAVSDAGPADGSTDGVYLLGTGNVLPHAGQGASVPAAASGSSTERKQFGQICRITSKSLR